MKILLVDGTNLILRYASAMLEDRDDCAPEDAERVTRGCINAVYRCAKAAGVQRAVVALDSVESWRKREYPEYKAHRMGKTGVWSNRFAIGLSRVSMAIARSPEYEADDVIATLVARAARAGHSSVVLSNDTDLLSLSSLYCTVYQKDKADFVPRSMAWVAEKFSIANPGQLPGFKALTGEPGDNLPGVAGIGKVKAAKLLAEHGSIERVMGSGALTAEQVEQCALMLRLVTLREDAPLDPIHPAETILRPLEKAHV